MNIILIFENFKNRHQVLPKALKIDTSSLKVFNPRVQSDFKMSQMNCLCGQKIPNCL